VNTSYNSHRYPVRTRRHAYDCQTRYVTGVPDPREGGRDVPKGRELVLNGVGSILGTRTRRNHSLHLIHGSAIGSALGHERGGTTCRDVAQRLTTETRGVPIWTFLVLTITTNATRFLRRSTQRTWARVTRFRFRRAGQTRVTPLWKAVLNPN